MENSNGRGVDASGAIAFDPSANVRELIRKSDQRQDDLRKASDDLCNSKLKNIENLLISTEKHQRELDTKESERLDSIRKVDREDGSKSAAQALAALSELATVTRTTADTLRNQAAVMAQKIADQRTIDTSEVNKRLLALELSGSEGRGKSTLSDPAMTLLAEQVGTLVRSQAAGGGASAGKTAMWSYVAAGFGFLLVLLLIVSTGLIIWNRMGARP